MIDKEHDRAMREFYELKNKAEQAHQINQYAQAQADKCAQAPDGVYLGCGVQAKPAPDYAYSLEGYLAHAERRVEFLRWLDRAIRLTPPPASIAEDVGHLVNRI